MRWSDSIVAAALAAAVGCGGGEGKAGASSASPKDTAAASARPKASASAASGPVKDAPGAGDKGGKAMADARPLARGAADEVTLPCKGAVYWGPFSFETDPQTLEIQTTVRSIKGEQVCTAGHFVNEKDETVGPGGMGCPEGESTYTEKQSIMYAPSRGELGSKQIWFKAKLGGDDVRPDDCASATAKLELK